MTSECPASFLGTSVPDGWDCCTLEELVDAERGISYGIVQPGKHDSAGVPIVRVNNLRAGRIETEDVLRVSTEIEAKYSRTRLRGGEVLLSLVGTLGECAVVPETLAGWNVARAVAVIPIRQGFDPRWITACLRSAPLQHLIHTWATTTVQATFNLRDVRRLPIVIPPDSTREWMISTLGSLDDKIELNRRMNGLLEGMARATFRAWFIDFEPVRAKADGASSFPGMPQAAFDDLPTTFVNSEIGQIPEGWEAKSLGEVFDVTMGQSPPSEYYNETGDGLPFHQGVRDYGFRFPNHRVYCTLEARLAEAGDVLLSVRAPVGRINVADRRVVIGRGLAAVRHPNGYQSYALYLLKHLFAEEDAVGDGTIYKAITKKFLLSMQVIRPPDAIVREADSLLRPLDLLLGIDERESRGLTTIRDTLLPKLISGEISQIAQKGGPL